MAFAVCSKKFEIASLELGLALVQKAIEQSGLNLKKDFASNVILLATPDFVEQFEELLQGTVAMTRCMSVWGGCVAGLWVKDEIVSDQPALLVGIFGDSFQTRHDASTVKISLADTDLDEPFFQISTPEDSQTTVQATCAGLLSYGANYSKLPRAVHGRVTSNQFTQIALQGNKPLWLNSEGLNFLSKPMEVTTTNGLFLIEVNGQKAARALKCPGEQTKPVGLRLQVLHETGETWIPVMNMLADGTLGLAAPVSKGQKVRLAIRYAENEFQLAAELQELSKQQFGEHAPDLGFLIAGMERSAICHPNLAEFESIVKAFPETTLIGILGQAVWLENKDTVVHPPRNNRLALCLFNSNE